MNFTVFIAAFYTVVCLVSGKLSKSCEPERVLDCIKGLQEKYLTQDGPFSVKSEAELNTMCWDTYQSVECLTKFVVSCDLRQDWLKNIQKALELQNMLCSDGEKRTVFLKHLDCYNREAVQTRNCMMQILGRVANDVLEKNDPQFCCHFYRSINCSQNVIRKCCPNEAAELYDLSMAHMVYQYTQVVPCGPGQFDLKKCKPNHIPFIGCIRPNGWSSSRRTLEEDDEDDEDDEVDEDDEDGF